MRYHLVTTALEETWPKDEPILFLGEWCRRYSRKDSWLNYTAEVLPYHWDDRSKLYTDYQYLQDLYEKLLTELSVQLNHIHGVNFSLRYWRILVGPWLGYFIQILFDRWFSLQQAIDNYQLSGTVVLTGKEGSFIPNDMSEFSQLILSDSWNHHIYSVILQKHTQIPQVKKEWEEDKNKCDGQKVFTWKYQLKKIIVNSYSRVAKLFVRDSDAFFLATYLPVFDELRLYLKFFQVPQRWNVVNVDKVKEDFSLRHWNLEGESHSEFEFCARTLISKNIPKAYLEGFNKLIYKTENLVWPQCPKIIWTSNAYSSDDVFKAWAATKTEQGVPLVIGQHGGGHGSHLWGFHEEHQLAICDYFLSWGWTENNQPNVVPVGELNSKRPTGINHSKQQKLLLITCALPRQSYHLYSVIVSRQWLDYFEDQCQFVEHLPSSLQDALTVRTYLHDYGWDQGMRWKERFPNLDIDDGYSNLDRLIKQSRINVSTYNATTFLESFSMDVPTVIFWNPNHWELRESAIPFFEELKKVGVFHETPESAADHIATIWDDVNKWWYDPEVRKVLAKFKNRYCQLPEDLLCRVEDVLKTAIKESKHYQSNINNR